MIETSDSGYYSAHIEGLQSFGLPLVIVEIMIVRLVIQQVLFHEMRCSAFFSSWYNSQNKNTLVNEDVQTF